MDRITWHDRFVALRAGILPLVVFGAMMGLFLTGVTSLVESSAVGALLATLAALFTGRLNKTVWETTTRNSLTVTCMFLWIILAALCFSSVYDGLRR